MRDYIVEQMNKGAKLENIQAMVEKMYKEESNKRESKQRAAALDIAARAVADYMSLATNKVIKVENVKEALHAAYTEESNAALDKGVSENEALMQFLYEMGFARK